MLLFFTDLLLLSKMDDTTLLARVVDFSKTSVSLDFEFRLGNSTHCLAQHSTFILSQRIQRSRSCSGLSASKSEGCVSQTHVGRGMYATVIWEVELVELFGLFFSFLLIVYLFIASQLTIFHVNTD